MALPRHERDQQVRAERHLAVVGARPVGDDLAGLDPVALVDDRLLVDAGALVGAAELRAAGRSRSVPSSFMTVIRSAETSWTTPAFVGDDDVAGVDRGAVLHAGADERRLGAEQRHGLALHVGAHQRAVGVVVLEERDHRGRDRHHLARRDVHVVDVVGRDELDLAALAADQHAVLGERVVRRSAARWPGR